MDACDASLDSPVVLFRIGSFCRLFYVDVVLKDLKTNILSTSCLDIWFLA